MPVHNQDIANTLNELADLLEIDGAGEFRVRAYRNAAVTVEDSTEDLASMVKEGKDLSEIPGIGESIAEKITLMVKEGKLEQLEELREKVPVNTHELMQIRDLGAKRLRTLYRELGIKSLEDLKTAAEENKISQLEGFGDKTEKKILEEINRQEKSPRSGRFRWVEAHNIATSYANYLKKAKEVKKLEIAGSLRRKKETVGDIDLLAVCDNAGRVMEHFGRYEEVEKVIEKGERKSSVRLRSGIRVDLRAVDNRSFGAAMLYFTGSKEHNVPLRKMGQEKGWKVNEYGIFDNGKRLAGKTEKGIYKKLGLKYVEPELRENRGEIGAAKNNRLPRLISLSDIRGDLQMHTTASDGKNSLREMAEAAREKNYEYIAITDHSKRVSMANGLDARRLKKHMAEIDKLNGELEGIRVLKSVEVDILPDGTLDLEDEVLKELDLVVCAIHYNMNLSRKEQTRRVLKAMENPYFHIFAHPTGRLIGKRDAYDIDMEAVIEQAAQRGCILEINASPKRLDLSDIHAKTARDKGVRLAISTDAHSIRQLNYMQYGINQARRGWVRKDDVVNTLKWSKIKALLKD